MQFHSAPHNTVRYYIQSFRIRHCLNLHHQIVPCVTGSLSLYVSNSCLFDQVQNVFRQVKILFDETFAMNCQI